MKKSYLLLSVLFLLGIGAINAQVSVLYSFNGTSGGINPQGALTLDGKVLFGMTESGGAHGEGTVFKIDTTGNNFKDLTDFDINTAPKGAEPQGDLLLSGNVLYGTTYLGGAGSAGIVFSVDTDGTNYTDMHDFGFVSDGQEPTGDVIMGGSILYGMTRYGGASGNGCIFSIHTDGSGYKDMFDFNGTNGSYPNGSLTLSGKMLFGMTDNGGAGSLGNVFSIDTNGNEYKDIMDFNSTNGAHPYGSLTLIGKKLFGMTTAGGTSGDGIVFTVDTNGHNYKNLLTFNGTNGQGAFYGSLTISGKEIFGMTRFQGANSDGNIFSVDTDGTNYNLIFSFNNTDGAQPSSCQVTLSTNEMYGMAELGGSNSDGVIFKTGVTLCNLTATINPLGNVICRGGSTGSATASLSGGTSPFTYSWAPSGGTNATASNLSAGSYTVTVTDKNSCSAMAIATITQPNQLTATASASTEVSCHGGNNGSVSATPSGGTSPYTYSWSGGGTNSTKSGLSIGTYTITVTDDCGATATASVTITQPAQLTVTASTTTEVSCHGGNNGSVSASPAGGTSPYTYSWSGGGTNSTKTGLSIGTYTITITDKNGCTATTSTAITQPTQLTVSASTTTEVSCHGESNGIISSTPSGGTPPYSYSWSNGGTTISIAALSIGTYTITLEDKNGCTATASATITQPLALTVTHDSVSQVGPCNGLAAVTVSGGTPGYTYLWSPNNQTTDTIKSQCAGTYCCVITDAHGCTTTSCVTVKLSTGVVSIAHATLVSIYPNPNTGEFTVCGLDGGMVLEMYDYTGKRISKMEVNAGTVQLNISDQPNGIYLIRILTKDGNTVSQQKVVKSQ